MFFELTNISVILFISTLINLVVAAIGWQRRKTKAGYYFALGITTLTFWTLMSGFDGSAMIILN